MANSTDDPLLAATDGALRQAAQLAVAYLALLTLAESVTADALGFLRGEEPADRDGARAGLEHVAATLPRLRATLASDQALLARMRTSLATIIASRHAARRVAGMMAGQKES